MKKRYKMLIIVSLIGLAFILGRYSVQTDIEKDKTKQTNTDTKTNKKTKTIVNKNKDGSSTEVTVIDETTETKKETNSSSSVVITKNKSKFSVSALVGANSIRNIKPIYGVSVSKEIFGPITIGAWGLDNKTLGVSVGINF